jgi:signal transduction histidine kinase
VTLSYMEHQVALDVRDDGKGFDAAQIGSGAAASRGTANGNGGPPARQRRRFRRERRRFQR